MAWLPRPEGPCSMMTKVSGWLWCAHEPPAQKFRAVKTVSRNGESGKKGTMEFMQIELNGTTVRLVNGGSLQKAAYDFNCGPKGHLHVYLSPCLGLGFTFLCAGRSLTNDELLEADQLLQEHVVEVDAEQKELLQRLSANT